MDLLARRRAFGLSDEVPDVTVIMPACAWPEPADMTGEPHPQLLAALDSVVAATKTPTRVELLVGIDGIATKVIDAVWEWRNKNTSVETRIFPFEKLPYKTFGNYQRNRLLDLRMATGRCISWQDQDDRYCPGALDAVVALAQKHPASPLIFRMRMLYTYPPRLLWQDRGRIQIEHIGGHMLVTPNEEELLARWEPETHYAADWSFISNTLHRFADAGRQPVWSETFISNLRPHVLEE